MADIYVNSATGNDSTGTGASGAQFATIQKGLDTLVKGDRVIVQAGSGYTLTANLTKSTQGSTPGSDQPNQVVGCTTTPGDGGKPVLTLSGSTLTAFAMTSTGWWISSFEINCNSQTASTAIALPSWSVAMNNKVYGFTSKGISTGSSDGAAAILNEVKSGTSAATAAISVGVNGSICNNEVHDNACSGIVCVSGSGRAAAIVGNLLYSNTGASSDGISFTYGCTVEDNTVYASGRDGIRCADFLLGSSVRNNVLVNNGGWGLNYTGTVTVPACLQYDGNFYYNNTSGARNHFTAGTHDVTLSGVPFTNTATGDFSLNNTAGSGAAVRGAAFPGAFPSGTTTGHQDGGAVQHADAGGGTTIIVIDDD